MSIWIRSQDKKKLVKSTNVFITYDNDTYIIKSFIEKYNYFDLGQYSTEAKALKVLDEIQKMITGKMKSYYSTSGVGKQLVKNEYYENTSNMVYQMPQDEEVKDNEKD